MRKILLMSALILSSFNVATTTAKADWAIAVGQSGSDGWAYGWASSETDTATAKRKALANCRSKGPNCKNVFDGAGGCIALAIGLSDNAWGTGKEDTKREAARVALSQCVKYSNGDCEVKEVFCDD